MFRIRCTNCDYASGTFLHWRGVDGARRVYLRHEEKFKGHTTKAYGVGAVAQEWEVSKDD